MSPKERGYGECLNSPNIMKKVIEIIKLLLFIIRGWEHVASIGCGFQIYRTQKHYIIGQSDLNRRSFKKFLKEEYCRSFYKALHLLKEEHYWDGDYGPYNPVVKNIRINICSSNTWGEQIFSYRIYKEGGAYIGGFTRYYDGILTLEDFLKERGQERYSDDSLQSAWDRYLSLELPENFYDEDLVLVAKEDYYIICVAFGDEVIPLSEVLGVEDDEDDEEDEEDEIPLLDLDE